MHLPASGRWSPCTTAPSPWRALSESHTREAPAPPRPLARRRALRLPPQAQRPRTHLSSFGRSIVGGAVVYREMNAVTGVQAGMFAAGASCSRAHARSAPWHMNAQRRRSPLCRQAASVRSRACGSSRRARHLGRTCSPGCCSSGCCSRGHASLPSQADASCRRESSRSSSPRRRREG